MTLNEFVIQILADRMAKELMNDPILFLRHIPSSFVVGKKSTHPSRRMHKND